MTQPQAPAFIGIIFDITTETIIERGTVEYATQEEAHAAALEMCKVLGDPEEDAYVYDQVAHAVIYG